MKGFGERTAWLLRVGAAWAAEFEHHVLHVVSHQAAHATACCGSGRNCVTTTESRCRASLTQRTTEARLTLYLRPTFVSDIPARRSATTTSWSMSSGCLPTGRPSSFLRLIPARMRSLIRDRKS